jgi:hypothetical protein
MAYETQPGTATHRVVEYLREFPEGFEMSCTEVAAFLEWPNARGLRSTLKPAVRAGVLAVRTAGPRFSWYSIGDGKPMTVEEEEPTIVRVSASAANSVFAYAQQRDAAPFSTAVSSDGRLIIQRNGRVIAELTPDEARTHQEFLARRGQWEMAE